MNAPRDGNEERPSRGPGNRRPVLVVGTDDWAVEQAVTLLAEAGHETLSCHPLGEPAFPCNAFVEGRVCPLDVGFDIVVSVRARPLGQPTVGETGVVCGLRAGAALVTAGMGGRNPFAPWATQALTAGDDLTAVVEAVAAASTSIVADLRDAETTTPDGSDSVTHEGELLP